MIGPLDHTFTAVIGGVGATEGWAVVIMPDSVEFFGTGKAVKVVAEVDGVEVTTAFLPNGDGTHLLPIKAPVRKKIGKGPGDAVTIHLKERLS